MASLSKDEKYDLLSYLAKQKSGNVGKAKGPIYSDDETKVKTKYD